MKNGDAEKEPRGERTQDEDRSSAIFSPLQSVQVHYLVKATSTTDGRDDSGGDGFRAAISHQNSAAKFRNIRPNGYKLLLILGFNALVQTSITGPTSHLLLREKTKMLKVHSKMSVPPAAATFHTEFKCFLPSDLSLLFCLITHICKRFNHFLFRHVKLELIPSSTWTNWFWIPNGLILRAEPSAETQTPQQAASELDRFGQNGQPA